MSKLPLWPSRIRGLGQLLGLGPGLLWFQLPIHWHSDVLLGFLLHFQHIIELLCLIFLLTYYIYTFTYNIQIFCTSFEVSNSRKALVPKTSRFVKERTNPIRDMRNFQFIVYVMTKIIDKTVATECEMISELPADVDTIYDNQHRLVVISPIMYQKQKSPTRASVVQWIFHYSIRIREEMAIR